MSLRIVSPGVLPSGASSSGWLLVTIRSRSVTRTAFHVFQFLRWIARLINSSILLNRFMLKTLKSSRFSRRMLRLEVNFTWWIFIRYGVEYSVICDWLVLNYFHCLVAGCCCWPTEFEVIRLLVFWGLCSMIVHIYLLNNFSSRHMQVLHYNLGHEVD